ncbi:MAG: hypothetical protein IJY27_00615 [Clostridia bacterium]|nr:hypothetical protein [Clostridia bacterium]
MNKTELDRILLLISIIERGKSKSFIEMMKKKNITFHLQTVGHGTAPSEMMDLFGLSSNDKDIVISLAPRRAVYGMIAETESHPGGASKYRGLTMVLPLSAINRLSAAVLSRTATANNEKGANVDMSKSENKYNLILMSVNRGYSEQVMTCAKTAGATGGTVIRGRLAGAGEFEQFTDIHMDDEKEIIAILAPVGICPQIMNSVNSEYGLTTEAGGIICSVAVENAFRI